MGNVCKIENFVLQADVWVEFQTYFRRDTVGGFGEVKFWIDGKLIFSTTDALMGSDDPTRFMAFDVGLNNCIPPC